MGLTTCSGCGRHVRRREAQCPFCETALGARPGRSRSRRVMLGGLAVAALLASCSTPQPVYGAPAPPDGSPSPSPTPSEGQLPRP